MMLGRAHSSHSQTGFSHHLILPLLAILFVGGIGVYLTFASKAAPAPTVRSASGFLNSIGVVAHLGKYPYNDPAANIPDKLTYLGIKHYRNGAEDAEWVPLINTLSERGIRPTFTIGRPTPPTTTDPTKLDAPINKQIQYITTNGWTATTDSIENYNEMDSPNGGAGSLFDTVLGAAVPRVWSAAQPLRSSGVKVLGPSLIGFKIDRSAVKLGGKINNTMFDYGNLHHYMRGTMPETSLPASFPATAGKNFNVNPAGAKADSLENKLKYYAYYISKDKPIIITEIGYHPDMGSSTEYVLGTYMPRVLLETFRIGITRTYVHMLLDEGPGYGYGLYRDASNNFEAKKASLTIHNLTTLLADGGPQQRLRNYAVSYSGNTTDLQKVLFQKNDGSNWLALWRKQSVYDTATKQPLYPSPADVTLTLPAARNLTYHTNLAGLNTSKPAPSAQPLGNLKTVTVSVGAEVSLLQIQ